MPISPDLINGAFEASGAAFLLLNVARLVKDKRLNGIHWLPSVFFSSWGVWNLYYYPSLGQMWSFFGGLLIVLMNTVWLMLVAYYAVNAHLESEIETWPHAD